MAEGHCFIHYSFMSPGIALRLPRCASDIFRVFRIPYNFSTYPLQTACFTTGNIGLRIEEIVGILGIVLCVLIFLNFARFTVSNVNRTMDKRFLANTNALRRE